MQLFKFVILGSLATYLTACDGEEFLADAEVGSNQAQTEFISNLQLDDVTRGAYFNLKAPGDYGPIDMLMYQDIASDNLELKTYSNNTSGSRNFAPLYNREPQINDIRWLEWSWAGAYTLIYNTNLVIDYYDDNGPIADELADQVPRIQGECHFLRSFAFYLLSTVYAPPYSSDPNAPSIILRTEPTASPTAFEGRSTNEEVYRQIVADAKRAIELLPEQYDASIHREDYQDRANRDAARFLLAKVYFHMGEEFWTSGFDGDGGAKEQIDALIASGRYPVEPADDLQEYIFGPRGLGQKAAETVWYAAYYFRNGWRAPRFERHYSNFTGGNAGQNRGFAMSKATLTELGWTDSLEAQQDQRYTDLYRRYEAGEDPTYPDVYNDPFNVWSNKFLNLTANFVVFRSPELYLMRSAIELNGGNTDAALDDVNVVRTRAGMPAFTELSLTDIEQEFTKEMGFEGRRLFFLQALQMDIPPGDRDGVGPIPYDDPSLVRELPEVELSRNPALGN